MRIPAQHSRSLVKVLRYAKKARREGAYTNLLLAHSLKALCVRRAKKTVEIGVFSGALHIATYGKKT